jgi:hypothetical protein
VIESTEAETSVVPFQKLMLAGCSVEPSQTLTEKAGGVLLDFIAITAMPDPAADAKVQVGPTADPEEGFVMYAAA